MDGGGAEFSILVKRRAHQPIPLSIHDVRLLRRACIAIEGVLVGGLAVIVNDPGAADHIIDKLKMLLGFGTIGIIVFAAIAIALAGKIDVDPIKIDSDLVAGLAGIGSGRLAVAAVAVSSEKSFHRALGCYKLLVAHPHRRVQL